MLTANGNPMKDAAGDVLKLDCLVRDCIFGEGKVKGTVPLDRGEGLNVLIEWCGDRTGKPTSRGPQDLTRVKGDRGPTIAGAAAGRPAAWTGDRSCSRSSTFVSSGRTAARGPPSFLLTTTPTARLR